MKNAWSAWRTGILSLIPLLVIAGFIYWLLNWLYGLTGNLFESIVLVWLINAAILIFVPLIFGWLIGRRWFRTMGQFFLGKLPLVGPVFKFLFNHDYVERIQSGNLKEVLFKYAGDSWAMGGLVTVLKLPDTLRGGVLVDWGLVLGPPTTPLAPTAQLLWVKKSDLIFTGRSYQDTIYTVASFGFNVELLELAKKAQGK